MSDQSHNDSALLDEISAKLLGVYYANVEFTTMQGAGVHLKVTVEGSALTVEQVVSAAADAFRQDAER
ncbi:MAG TPA: hypothetical protein VE465_02180 [Streptosporangiaceae bacterium]|jgi:hypothetical protein|nr:hypothetical protein [Streptosporangiaceae bacterium]